MDSLVQQAVISGASGGIGLATATRFLDAGYQVINLSRRPCPLPEVTHITCDLSQRDFRQSISPALCEQLAEADSIVLVHNAAYYGSDTAYDCSIEDFSRAVQVNVVAPHALNLLVLPFMKKGSSILVVGSTLSEKAVSGAFSYVTTKHAQIGLMRSLCQDLAGRHIHTACVCPGFTDTEMLRSHLDQASMESVQGTSTFGRLISPQEIAEALYWCATNPVINGSVIHANLGQIES